MLNDRDEKYEAQDDSEYHFSDEEVSYEVDGAEAPAKAAPASVASEGGAKGVLQYKRMLISAGVFVALIFVVYKMVSPPSTAIDTDIKAVSPVAEQAAKPALPAKTAQFNTAAMASPTLPATAPVSTLPAVPAPSQPAPAVEVAVQPAVTPQPTASPAPQYPPTQQVAETASYSTATSSPAPVVKPISDQAIAVPGAAAADMQVVTLAAQNERLTSQLQTQYDQRISEYQSQNKNLQDQLQTLTAHVADMEAKMSQVIQGMSRAAQEQPKDTASNTAAPVESMQDVAPKLAYTVQAIIPGRAWLKSDNGDTITVAEGDVIKDVGRITKIDPYDGVVEINTGKKTVSLSYGTGG